MQGGDKDELHVVSVNLWRLHSGTEMYQSPEMLMGQAASCCATDVWSLGCLLYELITRRPLFPGKSECLRPVMVSNMMIGCC